MCLFWGLLVLPLLESSLVLLLARWSAGGDSGAGDVVKRGGEMVTWGRVVVLGEREDGDCGLGLRLGKEAGGEDG